MLHSERQKKERLPDLKPAWSVSSELQTNQWFAASAASPSEIAKKLAAQTGRLVAS